MAQSISEGQTVNVTAPAGGYLNNQLVVLNGMPGVALTAAASGTQVALAVEGVFDVLCATTGVAAIGRRAFYRTATGTRRRVAFAHAGATGVTGGRAAAIGIVWESKASGASRTSIQVKLVGGPMPLLANN